MSRAGLAPLGAGVLALVLGTVLGWDPTILKVLVAPPELIRAVLVGIAVAAALCVTSGSLPTRAFWRVGWRT